MLLLLPFGAGEVSRDGLLLLLPALRPPMRVLATAAAAVGRTLTALRVTEAVVRTRLVDAEMGRLLSADAKSLRAGCWRAAIFVCERRRMSVDGSVGSRLLLLLVALARSSYGRESRNVTLCVTRRQLIGARARLPLALSSISPIPSPLFLSSSRPP